MMALTQMMMWQAADGEQSTPQEAAKAIIRAFDKIDFGYIALVIFLTIALIWLIRRIIPWSVEFVPTRLRLPLLGLIPISRLFLLVIAIGLILTEVVNLSRENILVIGGALGVALGFGFKDLVGSLIAGVVALFEKTYRLGDWVMADGSAGEVTNVGLRAFKIRTASDDIVTVAHNRVWDVPIINSNDGEGTLMCVVNFHVAPDHDADALRRALEEVALTSAYLSYKKPVIVQLREEIWGTQYLLKAYPFDMRDQFLFISDLTIRGKTAIRDVGATQVTASISAAAAPPK